MIRLLHLFRPAAAADAALGPDLLAGMRGDVARLRSDVDGLRTDVDHLRTDVDDQKDHVTVQMVKLSKDLTTSLGDKIDDKLTHFQEEQWEARLAFYFGELAITIRYWAKRLLILGVGGLGTALWALAGPKLAAAIWHLMGWQP